MRHWVAAGAACLLAAPALAEPATVTTHATARDRLPNTVADVQLAIEARGQSLAEVRAALSQNSPALLAALNGAGAQQVRTAALDVRPELDAPAPGRPPHVSGYSGRLATSFQVDAGKLGAVLAEALSHGANAVDGTTLHPRPSEMDAARDALAAQATRQALAQAEAVAKAAGRRLGPLQSVTVTADGAPPPRPLVLRATAGPPLAAAAPPPITAEAGDSEISVSVTAVTTLADP